MTKLIISKDEHIAIKEAVKTLASYSKSENVYVIVPDRASIMTEIEIINTLPEEGYLNIEVITPDYLCRKVNEEAGNISTKASSYVLTGVIKSLLNKNQEKLTCFKKASSNVGFAKELYSTILQIKASGIKPKELITDKISAGLKQKLSDISLIYEEYEKFLSDIKDDLSKFCLAIENIKTSEFIKNSHFMFLHNKSFTYWGEEILRGLIKYSKSVTIACEYNTDGLNEVYNAALKISTEENLKCTVHNVQCVIKDNNVKLFRAKTKRDEVLNAALKIKKLLKDGEAVSNISIAVCGLKEYEWEIKTIFESLNLKCFSDIKTKLSNFAVSKFILGISNVLARDFNQEDVLDLSKNIYFGLNFKERCNFENEVLKKGKTGSMFFSDEKLKLIKDEYDNFKNAKGLNEYAAVLLKIIEKFDTAQITEELETVSNGTAAAFKKALEIIEEFSTLNLNTELKYEEFIKILQTSFNEAEIVIAPIMTNTIFAGDVSESFFASTKHLFILGAKDGAFPATKQDNGLLLDHDIEELKNKIQPSVLLVNLRAKEKCRTLLNLAENVYLSYSMSDGTEEQNPSLIYSGFAKTKTEEEINSESLNNPELLKNHVISKAFLKSIFYSEYIKFLNYEAVNEKLLTSLAEIFKEDELLRYLNEDYNITESIKLFFSENRAGITEIEQYFNCPLKHFFQSGLKLKEQETAKLESFDVGNIYHEFLKEFEIYLLTNNNLNEKDIYRQAEKLKEKILKNEKYKEQLELKENALIKKVIDEEIPKIASNLYYHHINSNFKPKRDENGTFTLEYRTKYKAGDIDIIGKIDRIDYTDNAFRIIDYKTTPQGKNFSYPHFIYGLSLQLLVYSAILKETVNKDKILAGAFYYPVKIKGDSNFNAKLNGLILTDLELIKQMDLTFDGKNYSKMLPVALTGDGRAYSGNAGSKMLSVKQLNNIIEYSKNIINSAVNEILKGRIKPSVLAGEETCKYCPFFKIGKCTNILVRKKEKFSKESFGGGNE